MANPSSFKTVAWFQLGVRPGAVGSAVMAGHLDNAINARGVFENLNNLKRGDEIFVEGTDGRRARFVVSGLNSYELGSAPLSGIFATDGAPLLNLVTCDGAWDNSKKNYNKRLVASAYFAGQYIPIRK
jgi:sortase (surface protein transpeptidase)